MAHRPIRRILPGSDTAILFIHGIIGTPDHFRDFLPLTRDRYSVSVMLLAGHGGSVRDFSHASMKLWKQQVEQEVTRLLCTHKKLVIAAHSMGTLFALEQAVRRPERISFLFLLDCPLKLRIRPAMAANAFRVLADRCTTPRSAAARDAYGVERDWRLWRYLGWIPRYLELFAEIRKTRPLISRVRVPCYAFQSGEDEMVSPAAEDLLRENPGISVTRLAHSTHVYYEQAEYQAMLGEFARLLRREAAGDSGLPPKK